MAFTLKKTINIAAIIITVILVVLLTLGGRQYQLYNKQAQIIVQSEQLLFQYATVREHIIESLVTGQLNNLPSIATEVESLHAKISQIVQNANIPDEYKLTFVNEVDLAGIVLLLRQLGSGPAEEAKLRQLNRETRVLGERLMLFDRVLVNYAKRKVIAFQSIIIGAMAIVIFVIVNFLIRGQRSVVNPLIELVRQVKEVTQGSKSEISLKMKNISGEVSNLAEAFHNLLLTRLKSLEEIARHNRILYAVHRAGVAISRASTKEELFKEVSRALLFNEDYCMIWIGEPDESGQDLMPLMTDAVAALSDRRGEACIALLLSEAKERGEKLDPALRALREGKAVVHRDILADIPKGHLKDTPLAEGYANCVALPLMWEHTIYGVINIYSGTEDSFNEEEMKLLDKMASDVAFALYFLNVKRELQTERRMSETLAKVTNSLILTLNPAGEILSFNSNDGKLYGYDRQEVLGERWYNILVPTEAAASVKGKFHTFLNGAETELADYIPVVGKNKESKNLRCIFSKSTVAEDEILCVGQDICNKGHGNNSAAVQTSKLTYLGELTVDVAHEVNDLCNGIINYAQVLADEAKDENGQIDKLTLLDKIINEGERIAGIAQNLLNYGGCSNDQMVGPAKVSDVVAESLALVRHQFRNDGIQVSEDFKDDPQVMSVNFRNLQHVFLNILSNSRYALNQRYAYKDENKVIEIKTETVKEGDTQWLRTSITDKGEGIAPQDLGKVFDSGYTTKPPGKGTGLGLNICRELIERYGGKISIQSKLGDHTTVQVDLPLAQ